MDIIHSLQIKHPHHKVRYEPQVSCKRCNGTGEHLNGRKETTLCICTCVGLEGIGEAFSETINSIFGKNDPPPKDRP